MFITWLHNTFLQTPKLPLILPELNLEQVVVDQPTGLVINQPEQILNETILPVKTSRPSVRITATAMGVLNIKGLSERTSQNILQIQNSKVVTTTFTSSVFAKKAKDSRKSSQKKKKRKANSDLSDNEGGEAPEEEEDYTPKAKSKKASKKSAESSPAPTPAAASNDETPSVEEVCENFGLNDVDLEYSEADYQNLTTYKMFQQAYRSRIQSNNPKVRT